MKLKEILDLHKRFLSGEEGGKRANLCDMYLRGVDLRGVDLRAANLSGADLRNVDLRSADLRWVDLCDADLRGADLRSADLRNTDLHGAYLCEANLNGADIDRASWPISCGSARVKVDIRLFRQLIDHVITLDCDDEEAKRAQEWLRKNVEPSHVAKYLRTWEDANEEA